MVLPPDRIELERPYPFAEVDMRDEALCTACGIESYPWPARDLIAIAHRHPKRADGHWKIYCPGHFADHPVPDESGFIPELAAKAKAPAKRRSTSPDALRSSSSPRATAAPKAAKAPKAPGRRYLDDEKPRPVCPNCFVSVSLSGDCSICGERVEA